MKEFGINDQPKCPILKAAAGALANAYENGDIEKTKKAIKLVEEIGARQTDAQGGKLLQAIKSVKEVAKNRFGSSGAKPVFSWPTDSFGVRTSDKWGRGGFGASRSGGRRIHKGVDYLATPGSDVKAVISGTVRKIGYPYADDLSFRLIDIENSQGYRVRHFYVSPATNISVGSRVETGDIIGTYQTLTARYPGITDHVHIEVHFNGSVVDPAKYIRRGASPSSE